MVLTHKDGRIKNVNELKRLAFKRDQYCTLASDGILVHHPWKHYSDVETHRPVAKFAKMDVRNSANGLSVKKPLYSATYFLVLL